MYGDIMVSREARILRLERNLHGLDHLLFTPWHNYHKFDEKAMAIAVFNHRSAVEYHNYWLGNAR